MTELSPYLKRLGALREHGVEFDKKGPKIVFLDTPQGVTEVAKAIVDGYPIVTDYGTTFGTAFSPDIREQVAHARQEEFPLATVSLVTFRNTAFRWMDMSRIHPLLSSSIYDGKLDIIQGLSFLRYPATFECEKFVGPYCINPQHEVQTFIVPDSDPLMVCLETQHHMQFYAVRSSNITGKPEETHATGAMEYASEIASPIIAVRNLETFEKQKEDILLHRQNIIDGQSRQRIGSQPIIYLPSKDKPPVIKLVRSGNTDPDTIRRLLADVLSSGVGFEDAEEKKVDFRNMYSVDKSITNPSQIRSEILRHSNLL